ncbi:DUF6531 domain-containing protein, partial [Variovorax sp. ZT4R33]|uniref:DUF6531 domain-containing protein n=1 Tax=Variovorax sp. ZT4R33 TaxID=3443743 RepID=UPI003F44547A
MTTAIVGATVRRSLSAGGRRKRLADGLGRLLVAFALSLLFAPAGYAALEPVSAKYYYAFGTGFAIPAAINIDYDSAQAACQAIQPALEAHERYAFNSPDAQAVLTNVFGVHCNFKISMKSGYNGPYDVTLGYRNVSCPANADVSSDANAGNAPVCRCAMSFAEAGNSCIGGSDNVAAAEPAPTIPAITAGSAIAGMCTRNPILPASGVKYRHETDWSDGGASALSFARIYRSTWVAGAEPKSGLGASWTHDHALRLDVRASANPPVVLVVSPEGGLQQFTFASGAGWKSSTGADSLTAIASGWSFRRADEDRTFVFDSDGKLRSLTERNGWANTYGYNTFGQLGSITNPFGRTLTLAYNPKGQLSTATTSDARVIRYAYDSADRLSSVTYPDGKVRNFVYENTAFPQALTGIFDETSARWATFAYDSAGRAVSSALAGSVDSYKVSYPDPNRAAVQDPRGTNRWYSYSTVAGKLAVTAGTLPSGEGKADAASRVQDANGLITSETDFNGVQTTTTWDTARRLPLTVTRAAGTPEAQTTTTQWHATWALPVLITEAGRTTATTYDTQGRPLTRTVTHTAAGNKTQTTSWTYNPAGLAATETAPNGAATSYTYDAAGNVLSATNALGHVTSYTYDSANRLLSQTAPNGLVTTYTWDARDRLLTQTVGGQQSTTLTTTLSYTPFGAIATLTLPTGLSLSYSYDAAHRLTGWSNNRGESGSFTLDAMGN